MSKKIYLAPSNQTSNPYKTGGTNEAAQCQKIAKALEALLKDYDCECKIGLQEQTLQEKAKEANNWKASVYLSIHSNAGGGQGTEVWYNPEKSGSKDFASAVYGKISSISPGKDRGLKSSTAYLDVKLPNMPCCLCEMEFHDWKEGSEWICKSTNTIASAFLAALVGYLGLAKKKKEVTEVKVVSSKAFKAGDKVKIKSGAYYYGEKQKVPTWVINKEWIVSSVSGDRVVINKSSDGKNAINSPINKKWLNATSSVVEEKLPAKTITVGSTVVLQRGAKTYDGKNLASFVYGRKHKVKQINGQRVVITYAGITVAAVNMSDLELA